MMENPLSPEIGIVGPASELPNDLFDFTDAETLQLLTSLQQMPDVGRLFDGSIGSFSWNQ